MIENNWCHIKPHEYDELLRFVYSRVAVDIFEWDVSRLPLKENSVDVFITDLVSYHLI